MKIVVDIDSEYLLVIKRVVELGIGSNLEKVICSGVPLSVVYGRILTIFDEIEHDPEYTALIDDGKFKGVLCNSREIVNKILVLKGGDE